MSVIRTSFFSETLNMFTSATVILPLPRDVKAEVRDLPLLILLHGMGDGHSSWLRKTGIERYALARGVAVVMPDGGLSCYENMVHGHRYRDFITRELPEWMQHTFPVSTNREKNFIAGCSMGGFGALKLGLAHPEKWSAIGCFSGAHFEYRNPSPRHQAMVSRVYGDRLDEFDAQIVADAHTANTGKLPVCIWHSCGDTDALRENALKSRAFFEALPAGAIDYHFEMLPGNHDWALWDDSVRRFMNSLSLPEPEVHLL